MNRPEVHYPKNLNSRYKRHCFKNKIIRNRLISPLGIPQKRAPLGPHSLQRPDKLEALSQTNQHQKSSSIVESLKLLGQAVSIIVAIILLAFMSIVNWKANAHLISNMWETVAMVLICLTIFLGIYLISNVLKKSAFIVFVSVLVLIAIAKIVLISVYTIHPTSDFFSYHYLAFARVSGIAWTKKLIGINLFYPHVLNVALIDSIPYSIIGTNYLTAQVFNIILTLFDAILVYKLNKRIFNQSAGVFAAITFSLIPAYFLYTVLNGAEPLFLTAVLGMMLAFDTFVHLDDDSSIAQLTSSYRNLFLLSMIAYLIRPTVGIWLIAALLYLIFFRCEFKLARQVTIKRYLVYFAFAASFLIITAFSTPLLSQAYKLPLVDDSVNDRYSLATGTSMATNGQYSVKIQQQLKDDLRHRTSSAELKTKVTNDMNKDIQKNIKQLNQKHAWKKFITNKYANFANENYGYNWILYNSNSSNHLRKNYLQLKSPLIAFSTVFYEFMLIMSIATMGLILIFRKQVQKEFMTLNHLFYFSLLLNGFIIGSMLFEVQGRYHIILYIPLVMILGAGARILTERKKKLLVEI